MHRGYVKLHRSLVDWEWYKKPNMVQFFTHCLLRANHKQGSYKGVNVDKGQFISGRKVLSEETGLTEQQIRTCIKYLKSTRELTSASTKGIDGKYTVFTLNNWEKYQSEDKATGTSTNGITKGQPRVNQGLTTNKNVKNEKNVNIGARELAFQNSLIPFVEKYGKDDIRAFFDYWTEPNKSNSKMKWETQRTWDLNRRVQRWANNGFNSSKSTVQKSIYATSGKELTVEERRLRDAERVKQLEEQGVFK